MKKVKIFIALLLLVTLFVPKTVSLAVPYHTHTWQKTAETINSYSDKTYDTHMENIIEYYKCTYSGCLKTKTEKKSRMRSHNFRVTARDNPHYVNLADNCHLKTIVKHLQCACGYTSLGADTSVEPHAKYDTPIYDDNDQFIIGYEGHCSFCDWKGKIQ